MKSIKKIALSILKLGSALCVAYILTLIGQEFLAFGLFSFVFLMISISWAFLQFVKGWKWPRLLVLDICLAFLLVSLKFYTVIVMA